MSRELLTVEQVAAIFHVSPWTIRKWYREGKIAGAKIGWRILIQPEAVENLIRESTEQAEAVEVKK